MAEKDLIDERIKKLNELRKEGIKPYPPIYAPTSKSNEIIEKFSSLDAHEKSGKIVKIAGRIITRRDMGKVSFMDLDDGYGRIQLFFRQNDLGEKYHLLQFLDLGDFIGVEGEVFKTKTNQLSIWIKDLTILSKAIRPLPDKYHGLKDPEVRYRKRYLDLITNPDVRKTFMLRSKIIHLIREFLDKKEFMAVETPVLQPIYGGANARPFVTHLNALDMRMYLRISPELYLKRLIIGGFNKVYEICKNFRNEGIDKTHNPEFTMMELYQSYADYNDMMELTEDIYNYVAKKVLGTTKINYQGTEIDLKKPWIRITMKDALKKYADIDVDKLSDDDLKNKLEAYNIEYEGAFCRGTAISSLFEELVEDKLIQPTFVIDHPKESTPLCKLHRKDPELIERFEPYINGWEIGNAYSELNDPIYQRKVLEEQEKKREIDEEAHPMDEDFVEALETGMPPTGGLGLGIDRLVMLLTNAESIRDVIFFPMMKPKTDEEEKNNK